MKKYKKYKIKVILYRGNKQLQAITCTDVEFLNDDQALEELEFMTEHL